MGFLAPWFLAGAVAVGLPLWIHLLRFWRSTPHPFSSLMFFEQRTQSSIKHRRSEERRVGKEGRSRWSPYPSKKKPQQSSSVQLAHVFRATHPQLDQALPLGRAATRE